LYLIKLKKHVQHLSKKTNAKIAEHVGTEKLQPLHMESTKEFPRGISDQAIRLRELETSTGDRSPGPGLKRQASSAKLLKEQATSVKRQA
tara:strand:+ start:331 stop:600 length:270 start_codon:yes stop_codon:yes gene_type:complete